MSFFLRGNIHLLLLLTNCIWTQTFLFYWSVKRILFNVTKYNLPCSGSPCNWKTLFCEKESRAAHWGHTVCVCFCLPKLLTGLSLRTESIINIFISQWVNSAVDGFECGTCLVMLKHPSYTFSVSIHRQPKKQDVNAWRNACSPSQSWATGIGTRGKRAVPPLSILSFFLAFLAVVPSLSNGMIITPRPMQVSTSVRAKEEWCMVLSRKGRRTKKSRGATAGTGMHRGVFGEVTGASKQPVLAEGDYADVIALLGMEATWEPKFISCQSPCL